MLKLFKKQQPQQRDLEDSVGVNSSFSVLSASSLPPAAPADPRQPRKQSQPVDASAINNTAPSPSPPDQSSALQYADQFQQRDFTHFASPLPPGPQLQAGQALPVQDPRQEAVRSPPLDFKVKSKNRDRITAAAAKTEGKEPKRGFFLGGGGGSGPKEGSTNYVEGKVTEKIAWLCGSPKSAVDWSYVLNLADSIGNSEPAAKEAARAIRKEFKYGDAEAQRRAVRVWAILMMNASDRFRAQVATKRFLEVVEIVATSSKTDPTVVEKMLNVLAVLAYQYQNDSDLSIITKCWNKIRPKERPQNGEPLDPDSEDFNPPIRLSRSPLAIPPHNTTSANGQSDLTSDDKINGSEGNLRPPTVVRGDSDQSRESGGKRKKKDYSHKIISLEEDMRKLHEECHIGRTNANVLIDTLASSGLSSPLLEEFAHKVQLSQMFLAGQIDWASAQANRSRDYINEQTALAMTAERDGAPFSPPPLEETREEMLLADILSANERLMEALQMLSDARNPSPMPPLPPQPLPLPLPVPGPVAASAPPIPAPPAAPDTAITPLMKTIDIDDESIHTPTVPSEKALGKRRAFSDRGDAFDPAVQAQALGTQAPVHVPVKLHEVLEQEDDDDEERERQHI